MRIGDYEIIIKDEIKDEVKNGRILVQLPEGLKIRYGEFYDLFKSLGASSVFISGDPYYGACDMYEGKGFDHVLQIGHTPFNDERVLEMRRVGGLSEGDVEKIANRLSAEGMHKIGLLTTAQHLDFLKEVREALASKGFKVFVGKGKKCFYPGQLLGCDIGAARDIVPKVDGFIFIGDGAFHVIPIAGKVIALDPYTKEMSYVDSERHFRKRFAVIEWASEREDWLVVGSLKSGQMDLDGCELMKRILEDRGKNVTTIAMREITSAYLKPFDGKACTIVGCPRICEDIPGALNPVETLVALGLRKFEDYIANPFMDWKDEKERVGIKTSGYPG